MLPGQTIKDALDKVLDENDSVFLMPHNRPDMDAIGACIGMNLICNQKGKKDSTYIVVDDEVEKLEKVTRGVIKDIYQDFNVIDAEEAKKLITDKSLLIVLDTNKDHLISLTDQLHLFNDIVVIDHHKKDENTIKTKYLFVDEKWLSTCEEVSSLIFSYNTPLNERYASYLLIGIKVDTKDFDKFSPDSFEASKQLALAGANTELVSNMLSEDYAHDRAVQRIIENTIFLTYSYAIAIDDDVKNKYDIEDIAKAADYLLRYQVNASFAMGYIDDETESISARSKGVIDVSKIMKIFGGGGTELSSAARVKSLTIEEIRSKLKEILNPTSYLDMYDNNAMSLTLRKK